MINTNTYDQSGNNRLFSIEAIKPSFDSSSLNEQIVNALKACNVDMAQETMWSNILSGLEVVERRFSQYIAK